MQNIGYSDRAHQLINGLIRAAEKRAAALMRQGETERALEIRKELLIMVNARRRFAGRAR